MNATPKYCKKFMTNTRNDIEKVALWKKKEEAAEEKIAKVKAKAAEKIEKEEAAKKKKAAEKIVAKLAGEEKKQMRSWIKEAMRMNV